MKILKLIAISCLLTFGVTAQSKMKQMKWTKYKTLFQIPKNWKVTSSTARSFIAKGDGVVMKIGPYKSRTATAKSTARKAYYSYGVIKKKRKIQEKYLREKKSGLKRYVIFGKGTYAYKKPVSRRNQKVTFGIIGLINPSTVDSLYVRFYWFDKDSTSRKNRKNTWKIANSFKAMK